MCQYKRIAGLKLIWPGRSRNRHCCCGVDDDDDKHPQWWLNWRWWLHCNHKNHCYHHHHLFVVRFIYVDKTRFLLERRNGHYFWIVNYDRKWPLQKRFRVKCPHPKPVLDKKVEKLYFVPRFRIWQIRCVLYHRQWPGWTISPGEIAISPII
jgi:hypothetical protein